MFAPDGRIRITALNNPGSWHDSTQSNYGVYQKMKKIHSLFGGIVVVDSAFAVGTKDYLIQSSQKDPIGEAHGVLQNRAAKSVRQLSEWGMRMIQAQFPRIKDNIQFETKGERKVVLTLMVYLFKFQTVKVGQNQILNSYMQKKGYHGCKILDDTSNYFFYNSY